jgi:hypothetical protein
MNVPDGSEWDHRRIRVQTSQSQTSQLLMQAA